MKHCKRIFPKGLSFFNKIFLSFVALAMLIIVCLTIFLLTSYVNNTYNIVENFYKSVLNQSNYSVSYMNDLSKRLSHSLYSNNNVVAFLNLKKQDNMTTITASTDVRKIIMPLTYVESVYLYNGQIDLLLSTRNGEQSTLNDFYDTQLVNYLNNPDMLSELQGRPFVHTVSYNGVNKEICSYVMYEVDGYGDLTAALVINLSSATLTNSIDEITNASKKDGVFMVADEKGQIIGQPAFYMQSQNSQAINAVIHQYEQGNDDELFTINIGEKQYLTLFSNKNANCWLIICLIDRRALLSSVTNVTIASTLGAAILFVFVALLCLYISKRLHSPIKAITGMVRGDCSNAEFLQGVDNDEFEYLENVFHSMQERNSKLELMKTDTKRTLRQDFLISLLSGRNIYTLERTNKLLQELELEFLGSSILCLCVVKIDEYHAFFEEKSQQETWAYRYAISNILTELLREHFTCEIVNTAPDRFVVLINCDLSKDYQAFESALQSTMKNSIACVTNALNVSLSVAYSNWFNGLVRLPSIYAITNELIKLKMRLGNGCVISPQMLETLELEPVDISAADEEILLERIFACDVSGAKLALNNISDKLFTQSYSDVVPYIVYLVYVLNHDVCGKYPALRETLSDEFRICIADVSNCEMLCDIISIVQTFIELVITQLQQIRILAEEQGSGLIVARALEIIKRETANKALCLNFIAEELGLSANYVGTLFKNAQGVSVARYLQETRMDRVAYYLKETHYPLPKILDLVGLEMNNYFYTAFKKHFGMSMGKYKLTVLHQSDEYTDDLE